ncbi:hypothetical protein HK097_006760, partial [Rhizophlyctis rosea]
MPKENQLSFKPLPKETVDDLKEFYYEKGNILGRDRLYWSFKKAYPNSQINRRGMYAWLQKQEVHQLNMRPTMSRGTVRAMTPQKMGYIQLDCIVMDSYNGYDTVVNAVDIFSKRYFAYPCKGQTVENVKRAITQFINDGMKPSFIQSDQGSEFKGDFPQWLQSQGIQHQTSKAHSPWSNGAIESSGGNRFKKSLFQVMAARNTDDW